MEILISSIYNPHFLEFYLMSNQFSEYSDQELLDLFYKDGDNFWIGVLLQRYTLLLLGVSMKYLKDEEEAKDNVQQVNLKVLIELRKYKVEYFKTWLFSVVRNHCLMRLRGKNKNTIELPIHITELGSEENYSLKQHIEKENFIQEMKRAVANLLPEQNKCITEFYLNKKTYHQIAEETNFTMMQVKSYIQNGKRNLKSLLQKKISHE
jgi:RNA polymerase sigma factor (sigma-70 family)